MIGLSIHLILLSTVSVAIPKPVSPKNDHFNLKLYMSTSTHFSKCYISETIIVYCTISQCLIFLEFFMDIFLMILKVHLSLKTYNILLITPDQKNFENVRHCFVTTPRLFQKNILSSTCCLWLSKYRTLKLG